MVDVSLNELVSLLTRLYDIRLFRSRSLKSV
jgi:hypothetical protein